jgi:hypothetical protein
MAASKKTQLIAATDAYLGGKHREDPVAFPAEVKAIASHIGMARQTLYNWLNKGDPDIAALVEHFEAADRAARTGHGKAALTLTAPGAASMGEVSDAELARELREGFARAVWAMKQFTATVERTDGDHDTPLLMADFEKTLQTLRAIHADLSAPAAEQYRRRRRARLEGGPGVAPPPPTDDGNPSLWDDEESS